MKIKVLFVCMGNICRSPMAEGVLKRYIQEAGLTEHVDVDSAGTHDYHLGHHPDVRAQAAMRKRGYDISMLQARQIKPSDYHDFDLIFAMDWDNLSLMQQQCPRMHQHKLMLLMRYANDHEEATVPDPYYGTPDGFFKVLDYIQDACEGVLDVARKRVGFSQVV